MRRHILSFLLMILAAVWVPRAAAGELNDKWNGKTIYSRVNLRFEPGKKLLKAASTNFYGYDELVPVGTKFTVTAVSKRTIELSSAVNPLPFLIEYIDKHSQIPFDEFLERTFSKNPVAIPDTITAEEKKQIKAGTVAPGMSRAAIFLAIGYPPASISPNFEAKELAYQRTRFAKFKLHFGSDGKLASVEGKMTEAPAIPAPPASDNWTGKKVFNRVNLRARFDNPDYEAESTNYIAYSKLFPVGTEFLVLDMDKKTIKLREAGAKNSFVIKYVADHSQMPLDEYFQRTFAAKPVALPSSLSKREQELVRAGLAEAGMSRAALLLAIGYPPGNLNPSMEADKLVYMKLPAKKTVVHFDKGGKVTRVE